MGDYPGVRLSIDDDTLIPYYSWLAKTFVFSATTSGPVPTRRPATS
jgi:hypothetical protein